nr:MAG TPA: hypothetical protein [Caudoviricetes sp.]
MSEIKLTNNTGGLVDISRFKMLNPEGRTVNVSKIWYTDASNSRFLLYQRGLYTFGAEVLERNIDLTRPYDVEINSVALSGEPANMGEISLNEDNIIYANDNPYPSYSSYWSLSVTNNSQEDYWVFAFMNNIASGRKFVGQVILGGTIQKVFSTQVPSTIYDNYNGIARICVCKGSSANLATWDSYSYYPGIIQYN